MQKNPQQELKTMSTEKQLPASSPTNSTQRIQNVQRVRLRPAVLYVGGGALLIAGGAVILKGISLLVSLALVFGLISLAFGVKVQRAPSPQELALRAEEARAEQLKQLKRTISKTQYLENVGDLGERAAAQLGHIQERFSSFQGLLSQKFNPSEITYGRYLAAAEQTYLSILDNLSLAAARLNTLEAMEPSAQTRTEQTSRVNELFNFNEKAIVEFDRVSLALSDVQTRQGNSSVGLDSAMAELTELAARAKKYSVDSK
jgi:hypothetical protein